MILIFAALQVFSDIEKLNIENDNVALTLSNVVHINIEMLNDVDRRFKFQR